MELSALAGPGHQRRGAAVPRRTGLLLVRAEVAKTALSLRYLSVCEAVPGAAWLADSALPSEKRTVSLAKPAGENAMLGPPQCWMRTYFCNYHS